MAWYELSASVADWVGVWVNAKTAMKQLAPFESGWLHLIVGPIVFVGAALAMRKPFSSWHAWVVVFMIAAINEWIDLAAEDWQQFESRLVDSTSDFLVTMAVPSLWLIVARHLTRPERNSSEQREYR